MNSNSLKLISKLNNYKYESENIDYHLNFFINNQSYKVPSFQRDYVWKTNDIINLLNSLIKGEPIGYIILWNTNEEELFDVLGERNEIIKFLQKDYKNDSSKQNRTYIIDGQQRLTTLSSIKNFRKITKMIDIEIEKAKELSKGKKNKIKPEIDQDLKDIADKLSKIVFDININKFIQKNKKDIDSSNILLKNIFSDKERDDFEIEKELSETKLYENFSKDEIKSLIKIIKDINKIWNLKIGSLILTNFMFDEVIDIFNNINNKGKPLSTFDLVKSKWNQKNIMIENQINQIKNTIESNLSTELNNDNFKNIFIDSLYLLFNYENEKHIFANKHKTLKNISDNEIEILKNFEESFIETYHFLNDIIGIDNIPSDNIIKWVSYFYYLWSKKKKNKPEANIRNKIKQYLAIISINKIYSNATEQKLRDNLEFVENLINNNNLNVFDYISKYNYKFQMFTKEMIMYSDYNKKNSSQSKIINSFYKDIIICDFKTGQKVANKKEKYDLHHLFPKKCKYFELINDDCKQYINSFANITRIDPSTNKFIGDKNPSDYYNELSKLNDDIDIVLKKCLINVELFKNNKFMEFIEERAAKIAEKLNETFNLN